MSPRRQSIRHLLIAALLVAIAAPIFLLGYVRSGLFDVAASHPHSKIVEWLTHETMIHSVKRRARNLSSSNPIRSAQAVPGFCQYEAHCVTCHGAAAVGRERWVNGMNPPPPYLLDMSRRWSPGDLEWIVANGIKMTGMPAWRETMTDVEIRDVVAFLEAMPKMPPQTYLRWRSAELCAQSNRS
jgi:cytochrome c553